MKKFLKLNTILFITLLTININKIKAKSLDEVYYTNANNVSLTKEQYDFFTNLYYEGYQRLITIEELNSYSIEEIKPELVETKYLNNNIQLLSTSHNDLDKNIKISSTPYGSYKMISTVVKWTTFPTIKSYDLIGANLSGVIQNGQVKTILDYRNGSYESNDIKKFNNGFGVSIKLPTSGSNDIIISQSFKVTTGGTVYASYQHATSNITLERSKNYTIGLGGYGNVFKFTNGVGSYYDGMQGVSIDV